MNVLMRRLMNTRLYICAIIIMLPIFANAPALLDFINADPALGISGLGINVEPAVVPDGAPDYYDGATGGVMQPLAVLSANDWLHGIIPWWDPYTGVGMPLAAEMVGQAFFLPFVFLFKLKTGWIWFRITLEIASGLAMFGLLNYLKLRQAACLIGAVLYELNSSFFMFPQGMGPLPFLPLLLLGIEHAFERSGQGHRYGGAWVGLSIAYCIYAGFPEVAYIDGMLAGVWTIWRLGSLRSEVKWLFARMITVQILLGVAMALPLILPFGEYVKLTFLGPHNVEFAHSVIENKNLLMVLLPYVYGPIGGPVGGNHILGWFGLAEVCLAIIGVIRSDCHRGLAHVLVAYITFWLLRCVGFPPAMWVANLIPLMAHVNVVRFCWPSIEAALFVLSALGIDSWLSQGPMRRNQMVGTLVTMVAIMSSAFTCGVGTLLNWRIFHASQSLSVAIILTLYSLVATGVTLWLQLKAPTRRAINSLTILLIIDVFVTASAPQLSTPRAGTLDLAPINFLQSNLGTGRIFSLGAFNQDYPASYGLAAINSYAQPVANDWVTFIHNHLDPRASGVFFDGIEWDRSVDSPITAFGNNLPNYLDIGMKFVLVAAGVNPIERRAALPVRENGEIMTLQSGQSLTGTIAAGIIHIPAISGIEVRIGPKDYRAPGRLDMKICQAERCADGQLDLSNAFDDKIDQIALDRVFPISPSLPLRYIFSNSTGQPVLIWLGEIFSNAKAGLLVDDKMIGFAPWMRFDLMRTDTASRLAFHDKFIDIYEVADSKPFFSSAPGCTLTTINLNHVIANCAAPGKILRLEAWYPGWHVLVNGHETVPERANEIFQSVSLPAGKSTVQFFYIPVGTRYAVAIAIAALLAWLAGLRRSDRLRC